MKTGRSLQDLATELERQQKNKRDYLADTRKLTLVPVDSGHVRLDGINGGGMELQPIAHQQLAASLGIPKPYYDHMLLEAPDLLTKNVNHWLEKQPAKKLVRTLDNRVRAILSDAYRPLDNLELAEAVLPKLIDLHATVVSGEVTDNRFYLKAITERLQGEVKTGDIIQAGVAICNSEVGQGSLRVEALDYRLVCLNGMISERAIRKAHLGRGNRNQDALEDAREFFRSETRIADDRAFFLKVGDTTGAMFNPDRFDRRLNKYREVAFLPLAIDPVQVIDITATRFGFNDGERAGILQHLIRGGDLTQWGLANAVTRMSQDVDSYDRATEFEAIGGAIVELAPSVWAN